MYIGLVERDAEVVYFGQPDCTTEVLNQFLFAGAGYRATVGVVIGDDVFLVYMIYLREAEGFFERNAGNFLIVSLVELRKAVRCSIVPTDASMVSRWSRRSAEMTLTRYCSATGMPFPKSLASSHSTW